MRVFTSDRVSALGLINLIAGSFCSLAYAADPVIRETPNVGESPVPWVAPKTLTDDQKRELDSCWIKSDKPAGKPVVAFYSLGKDELPDGASLGDPKRLEELFEKSANEARRALFDGGYGKIAKVEATSSASQVRGKTKTPEQLANIQSGNATSQLLALIKLKNTENGPVIGELKSLESTVHHAGKITIGPKWVPADYVKLSKVKVTDAALTKAAEAIINSPDHTPIKVMEGSVADQLRGTKEKLRECCDMNAATLKYQPYQFTQIKIFGAKFAGNSETCIRDAKQIAAQRSVKTPRTGAKIPSQVSTPGDTAEAH